MAKGQSLQDPFLNALRKERIPVSIYLVNGIKLQGQIDSFDQFVVLLRNSVSQMVYKHAISTVVPARNVRLPLATTTCRRSRTPRRAEPPGEGKDALFERPGSGERAILVCVGLGSGTRTRPHRGVQRAGALGRRAGARSARAHPQVGRSALLRRHRQGRGTRARASRRSAPTSSSSTAR